MPKEAKKACEWLDRTLRVVNVHYENFAELRRRGLISFPIEIEMISDKLCAITDKRVPPDWKLTEPCSSCIREEHMAAAQAYCQGKD